MGVRFCRRCGFTSRAPGCGRIPDPDRKWWQFWKTIVCPECGGDGYSRPKGTRPKPTPCPPPTLDGLLTQLLRARQKREFEEFGNDARIKLEFRKNENGLRQAR